MERLTSSDAEEARVLYRELVLEKQFVKSDTLSNK
jgi:hypothetical protein